MQHRLWILALTTAALATESAAFRRPDPAVAPLAFYDIRTHWGEVAEPNTRKATRQAARNYAKGFKGGVHVRTDADSGRPNWMFSFEEPLTPASPESPERIARGFLAAHPRLFGLGKGEISAMAVVDQYLHPSGDTTFLTLKQKCSDLDVYEGGIHFAIDRDGRLIHVSGAFHPDLKLVGPARLSAQEAIRWAAAHCDRAAPRLPKPRPLTESELKLNEIEANSGPERRAVFSAPRFRDPVAARLVAFPVGSLAIPAWETRLHIGPGECYHVLVDARDGSLLYRTNLYKFLEPAGLVFREHPAAGPATIETFTGHPVASPLGWCDESGYTQGNNVLAREDWMGDDDATTGFQPYQPDRQFLFPFNNSWADQQTTGPDANLSITNLFYLTNWYHDYLYRLGFDEGSGNFQLDNFGRGGVGGDRVHADALDGRAFNSSSFLTLPDGDPPGPYGGHSRIEMFLFKPAPPSYQAYGDGDLDGDVVLHEYTHGLTGRIVGGPSNNLALEWQAAKAMAEGWSDFFPCSVYDDPVMGEYVSGKPVEGARHAPYDFHPWTFGVMGRTWLLTSPTLPAAGPFNRVGVAEVHDDGEIWAAALWAVRDELGSGHLAEFLVLEGLRYTPVNPTYLDGRDAILLADAARFQGIHREAIWRGFARRGMGWSAEAETGRKAALTFQAFDWPPEFGGAFTTGPVAFDADVEGDLSAWTVTNFTSGTGVAFHPTQNRSAGGGHSWYFGREGTWDYDTGRREWSTLESPEVALSTRSGHYLEFKHFRAAEDSIDWTEPPYYFDPGFVYLRRVDNGDVYFLGMSFHNTNGWERRRIDISDFAGLRIRVGFYFDTWDGYNPPQVLKEGWYIDDVRIVRSQTINTPRTSVRTPWEVYP